MLRTYSLLAEQERVGIGKKSQNFPLPQVSIEPRTSQLWGERATVKSEGWLIDWLINLLLLKYNKGEGQQIEK